MSQSNLEALATQEDIQALREMVQEDPNIEFIRTQLNTISTDLATTLNELTDPNNPGMPALDLSDTSIKAANVWLKDLQSKKDKFIFYQIRMDEYESIVQDHWSRAYNICMIQPIIEGLRSNDQRNAYIEQLFESLIKIRRSMALVRKKIQILQDNLESRFHNMQQQQRNLQLAAQVSRIYGNPS